MKQNLLVEIIIFCFLIFSCSDSNGARTDSPGVRVNLSLSSYSEKTKSGGIISGEEISDLNLYLFRSDGELEYHYYTGDYSETDLLLPIINGNEYYVYIIGNINSTPSFGNMSELEMGVRQISDISDISDLTYGIPIAGKTSLITLSDGITISVSVMRLYAALDVSFDFSNFTGQDLTVTSVAIKNIPNQINYFQPFQASSGSELIQEGYSISGLEINRSNNSSVTLYSTENLQGNLLQNNILQEDKILTGNIAEPYCTYLEITAEYQSDEKFGTISYRLYPGKDNVTNFDIERNYRYNLIISPTDKGLGKINWRIDTTMLSSYITGIDFSSDSQYLSYVGEQRPISYRLIPPYASNQNIIWSSSDESIVSVSESGEIRGNSEGRVTITATIQDGRDLSATCEIACVKSYGRFYKNSQTVEVGNWVHCRLRNIFPQNFQPNIFSNNSNVVQIILSSGATGYANGIGTCIIYGFVHPYNDTQIGKYLVDSCVVNVIPNE